MKKDHIFPIIVFIFSAFTIIEFFLTLVNYLALLNSILGITGVILYFLKKEKYRGFLNGWIYLQFILITKTVLNQEYPVVDFTQFFKLPFGLGLTIDETSYQVALNFLPFIYLIAFKRLQTKSLIGKKLTLRLYRENEILNNSLPQEALVMDVLDFPKNKNWFLIELTKKIDFEDNQYNYALVKSKDDNPILLKKKNQMAYIRLVQTIEGMEKDKLDLNNYLFIDWIFVG